MYNLFLSQDHLVYFLRSRPLVDSSMTDACYINCAVIACIHRKMKFLLYEPALESQMETKWSWLYTTFFHTSFFSDNFEFSIWICIEYQLSTKCHERFYIWYVKVKVLNREVGSNKWHTKPFEFLVASNCTYVSGMKCSFDDILCSLLLLIFNKKF